MNNMEITASYIIVRDLREKLLGYLVLKSSKRMFVCSKKKGRNRAKKIYQVYHNPTDPSACYSLRLGNLL
jgi:hypothetical protein